MLKQSKAGLAQSLVGITTPFPWSWGAQGFFCTIGASLVGLRFYFKCDCAPPAVFLGLLLIAMSVLFHSVVSDITLRYFANRGPYSQSYGFSSSHA